MDDHKKLLIKILDITEFEGDKNDYAEMLISYIMDEAVYILIRSLPQIKQDKIARKWHNNIANYAAIESLLTHYFTKEQIENATRDATVQAISGYFKLLKTSLDDEQKEKLSELAVNYVPNN